MDVAGKLVHKQWSGKVEKLECSSYTTFKYLALDEGNIAYAIAAGPCKSSSVIRINLDTNEVNFLVLLFTE